MQHIVNNWLVKWGWGWAIMVIGCQPIPTASIPVEDTSHASIQTQYTSEEILCGLTLASDCSSDHAFFLETLGWSTETTDRLMAHRNGGDELCDTTDDGALTSLSHLLAAIGSDTAATELLLAHAVEHGCENVVDLKGVPFTDLEAAQTIRLANIAALDALIEQASVSAAAAQAIVRARPFSLQVPTVGLMKLAATDFVGSVTLHRLRDAARQAFRDAVPCLEPDTVVSDVHFTAEETHNTVDLVNHALQPTLALVVGVGPIVATWIVDARTRVSGLPTVHAVDLIAGVGPNGVQSLKHFAATQWCTTPSAMCGCKPKRLGEDWLTDALALATDQLSAHDNPPFQRFRRLLGTEGYERLAVVLLQELHTLLRTEGRRPSAADIENLDTFVASMLSQLATQARFVRPFETISTTPPLPGQLPNARQGVSDALIQMLGDTPLEDTDIGVPFDLLIEGSSEAMYLDDIDRWRGGATDDPEVTTLAHVWMFSGTLLGLPTSGTVSRATGVVLAVEVEVDGP